jgi:uncharacterized membrane protein YpjA
VKGKADSRTRFLKRMAIVSAGLIVLGFGYYYYCIQRRQTDCYVTLLFPYLAAIVSFLVAVVVVVGKSLGRSKQSGPDGEL